MTTADIPMGMPRAPAVGSQPVRVGVLAATPKDTEFGAATCRVHGYVPICAHISKTPQGQTKLQMREPKDGALTKATIAKIHQLVKKGVVAVVIYCNSLSSAVNLKQVRRQSTVPVITPLDAYEPLLQKYACFGVLAANCQCLGNLERFVLNHNNQAIVVGLGTLSLVNDIEQEARSREVMVKRQLTRTVTTLQRHGAEIVLLACTHFVVFAHDLERALKRRKHPLRLYEPTKDMMSLLARQLAA